MKCVTLYAIYGRIIVESDNDQPEPLIRISTAAKRCGMAASSLYSAIERGKLPYTAVDGWKMVRFSDVEAYQARAKVGRPRQDKEPEPIPEDN